MNVITPLLGLNAVITPVIQADPLLTTCTNCPTVNVLPVCAKVSVWLPVPTVNVLVLVACVPGALSAVAALAAAALLAQAQRFA